MSFFHNLEVTMIQLSLPYARSLLMNCFKRILFVLFASMFLQTPNLYAQSGQVYKIEPIAAEKVPLNQELSQGRVSDIVEDDRGFVWIGTMDGLNRYDGYKVKVFRHEYYDSCSIDNNQINKLVSSKDGILWVLTKTGINKFNTYTEESQRISLPQDYKFPITINDIAIDHKMNLWIASTAGLFLMEDQTNEIQRIELADYNFNLSKILIDQEDTIWLGGNSNIIIKYYHQNQLLEPFLLPDFPDGNEWFLISDIHQDYEGNIWIADNNPLYGNYQLPNVFVKKKDNKQFLPFSKYSEILKMNHMEAFLSEVRGFESRDKQLWLVTTSQSIACIDFNSNTFIHHPEHLEFYYYREVDKKTLFFDSHGNLWLGTNGQGAFIIPNKKDLFKLVNRELEEDFYLKSIRAFYVDDDYLWVGGYNGMLKMDRRTGKLFPLVTRDVVYCIEKFPDEENALLLGIEGGGLKKLNLANGKLENLTADWVGGVDIKRQYHWIFDIYNDGDSIYWCGAKDGILKRYIKSNTSVLYGNDKESSFNYGNILNFYRAFDGRLFAGSDISGLLIYNEELRDFELFESPSPHLFDFYSFRVNHMNQTLDSTFWISTDKGLIKMDKQEISLITKEEGMLNDFVYAAISDDQDHLWLSTNGGICSYNIKNQHITTFSINDGLQGLEFNTAAYYKSKEGIVYFGGVNGFNYFSPALAEQKLDEYPIAITGIYFNNEEFKPKHNDLSPFHFSVPPSIEYFKIEFASLNYVSAPQNRYKYRIDGIHEDWIDLGHENEIGFHGLEPDTYELEILASDHHGSWGEIPMKIVFKVEARYWETTWFKYGLLVFVFGFVLFVIHSRLRRLKLQKMRIEKIVEERTKELSEVNKKLRKVNETKEKFLTIISHDIKNPLAAAQSVSFDLKENYHEYSDEERNTLLGIMYRSLNHLQELIVNLSSWSRLQHQEINAELEDCDLNSIIQENIELIGASLLKKNLRIESDIQQGISMLADSKMMDTILRNLLSNAIKFSYPNSEIHISACVEGSHIKIAIKDSGVGMSKEIIEGLFSSERSQSLPGTANEKGTGFGLLMIKEFVKLNQGEILVESKEGEGSVFKLVFPAQEQ